MLTFDRALASVAETTEGLEDALATMLSATPPPSLAICSDATNNRAKVSCTNK